MTKQEIISLYNNEMSNRYNTSGTEVYRWFLNIQERFGLSDKQVEEIKWEVKWHCVSTCNPDFWKGDCIVTEEYIQEINMRRISVYVHLGKPYENYGYTIKVYCGFQNKYKVEVIWRRHEEKVKLNNWGYNRWIVDQVERIKEYYKGERKFRTI